MNTSQRCGISLLSFLLAASVQSQTEIFPHYGTFFNPSTNTSAFDNWRVVSPAVVRDSSGYRLWYGGFNVNTSIWAIGTAHSSDGFAWVRNGIDPVLAPDPGNPWESTYLWVSSVVVVPGGYRMYYGGYQGTLVKVGTALSRNGISWTRAAENPVLLPGPSGSWDDQSVWGASVLRLDSTDYRMWYAGQNTGGSTGIGYATSLDGVHWTKYPQNPVMVRQGLVWDAAAIYNPRVAYDGVTFHMYYQGLNSSTRGSIGYAYSPDGIRWTRSPKNPVLSAAISWLGGTHIVDPAVVLDGKFIRLWYCADDWRIGYALSEFLPTAVAGDATHPSTIPIASAFPNPFNPSTTITCSLPQLARVTVTIRDLLGREVALLCQETRGAGEHRFLWNAERASSGVYIFQVTMEPEAGSLRAPTTVAGKLVLLK